MAQTDNGAPQVSRTHQIKQIQTELTLSDLLLIIRRRKAVSIIVLGTCMTLALLVVMFTPRRYSSSTVIEVNKDNAGLSFGLEDLSGIASGLGGSADLAINLQTELEILKNDNTAIGVVEKLDLLHSPEYARLLANDHLTVSKGSSTDIETNAELRRICIAEFSKGLKVTAIKGSRLIEVQYIATDPNFASSAANAAVDVYLSDKTKERYDASSRTSQWLGGQLRDLKDRVEKSQRAVSAYQREHNLIGINLLGHADSHSGDIAHANNAAFERLEDLNRQLTSAEVQRIAKEAIYRLTQSQDADLVLQMGSFKLGNEGTDSTLAQANLVLLQNLRQRQAEINVNLAAAVAKYGVANPVRTELQSQVLVIDDQIHHEIARLAARAKGDFEVAKVAENNLREEVNAQQEVVGKLNNDVAELAILQQEAFSSGTLYQDLYSKLEEANIAASVRASNITVVDPARPASQPFTPKPVQDLALALALGLLLGLLGTFIVDYFDDAVITPTDVEGVADIPMMGLIPVFDQDRSSYGVSNDEESSTSSADLSKPWIIRKPQSNVSESYRQIRTNLLLSQADKALQVIALTSPLSADGKSTTAINLAISFAFQNSKVLLIDADLRRPSIHNQLNIEKNRGLSSVLAGTATLDEVIAPVSYVANLDVLTAGPSSPMPSELLGSERFTSLIETVRKRYDYIVLDTPPLLIVSDPLLVATRADGVIVVLRSRVTTRAVLRRMFSVLNTAGVPLLGFIMNAANISSADYYYYGVGTRYAYKYGSTPLRASPRGSDGTSKE